MTRKNWGPKPKLMRWAYIGIVRPMLCYGAMIWGHRAPELLEKFRRINRMAMNTFANFPKSTPTTALEIMLDVMPLHLFCVKEALAARVRLHEVLEFGWHGGSHTKNHACSHMKFLEDKLAEFQIRPGESDVCSQLKWNTGFKINWDSFNGEAKHRQPSQYKVFTDGSKLEGRTGAGLVVYKNKKEIATKAVNMTEGTTVFQAEVLAISEAALIMGQLHTDEMKYVKFMIDSQAAIAALGNPHVTSKVVAQAIDNLNALASMVRSVTLVWIPAHKGHVGNERADDLAKAGSKVADNVFKIGTPMATVKMKIRENVYALWQTEWSQSKIANHASSFYGGPSSSKARFVYKLARLELGRFVRIISGDNNLNFFQTKIGLHNNADCRFCGEGNETITHLILSCPRFQVQQRDIFMDKPPTADMTWSVRGLLNFSYVPGINDAYEGNWTMGDTQEEEDMGLDLTLCLDRFEDDPGDVNNNDM